MITGMDHIVVLVEDIGKGRAAYEALLGCAPSWQNSGDGADRVLFTLDNMTLELVAPSGAGVAADHIRQTIAADGEGLASLCFATTDITKMHRRLERVALKPEPIADGTGSDAASGAMLKWKRTRASTKFTRGVRLFFLQLDGERPRSRATTDAPVTSLDHVVVATADSERAAALYGARLGMDMALDRSHPDWGQLMFFRCGDLIVEVVRRPGTNGDAARDKLWGVTWRVEDMDAARTRLTAAGIDASEIRTGRKPGTRVMSVRGGTCGVPTLFLERTPRAASN